MNNTYEKSKKSFKKVSTRDIIKTDEDLINIFKSGFICGCAFAKTNHNAKDKSFNSSSSLDWEGSYMNQKIEIINENIKYIRNRVDEIDKKYDNKIDSIDKQLSNNTQLILQKISEGNENNIEKLNLISKDISSIKEEFIILEKDVDFIKKKNNVFKQYLLYPMVVGVVVGIIIHLPNIFTWFVNLVN